MTHASITCSGRSACKFGSYAAQLFLHRTPRSKSSESRISHHKLNSCASSYIIKDWDNFPYCTSIPAMTSSTETDDSSCYRCHRISHPDSRRLKAVAELNYQTDHNYYIVSCSPMIDHDCHDSGVVLGSYSTSAWKTSAMGETCRLVGSRRWEARPLVAVAELECHLWN